jgi:hypothetical protein
MYAPQEIFLSAYTVCPEMLSKNPRVGTAPSEMHTATLHSIMHVP